MMMLNSPTMIRFAKYLKSKHIPCVDILNDVHSLQLPRVLSDYSVAAKLAARHFQDCGFRHSAFFAMEHTSMHDACYQHFVEATEGEPPLRWIWEENPCNPDNYKDLTVWIGNLLIKAPKPIAVWCFNDYNAASFADICWKAGVKIPQDVAILGYGDISMYTQTAAVPISSVAVDWEQRAKTACSLLERQMNGEKTPDEPILIKPRGITIRKSTDGIAITDQTLRTAVITATDSNRKPCGVEQLAREMNVPRQKLNALSKIELGKSLHSAIISERIRKAERLLTDTDAKLSTIAADIGFCHASYLIKLFRRAKGITPTEWRKQNRSTASRQNSR